MPLSDRRILHIENDSMRVGVLPGGGHLGSVELKSGNGSGVNPLWNVPWPSMEPEAFVAARDLANYGGPPEGRLLASIMGHNLCLDYFGGPSKAEEAAGLTVHGETSVATWMFTTHGEPGGAPRLDGEADLPYAGLKVRRTLALAARDAVLRVDTDVENLRSEDRPIGWQEHVTFGPPFLEKGVTACDLSAVRAMTNPEDFARRHRLPPGREFTWPVAPGLDGTPRDLRVYPADEFSGDFTTQLLDPGREWAWLTAVNPRLKLLCGYLWKSSEFPWIGNWEENYDRLQPPWSGRTLARGMEFGLSPFAQGKEAMQKLGRLFGVPTLGTIAGHGRMKAVFYVFLAPIPSTWTGTADVGLANGVIRVLPAGQNVPLELRLL